MYAFLKTSDLIFEMYQSLNACDIIYIVFEKFYYTANEVNELKWFCKSHFLFILRLFQLQQLVSKNYFLHTSAKDAFKSYIRAYDAHHLKDIFNIETIDLAKSAKSFGFEVPPSVDLSVCSSKQNRPRKRNGGGGFGFPSKKPKSNYRNTNYVNISQKNKK